MTDAALEIRRLRVRREGRDILRVDEMVVPRGQTIAILGPNGAGKSTLVKCVLGFLRPTEGQLCVLGQDVTAPRFHFGKTTVGALSRLRRRIGYVPQLLTGHGETPLTVREVVAVGRTGVVPLLHRLRQADWRIVDRWIDQLGLGPLAGRGYAELSGGEQRKALVAKAMAQEPEILLLDEPTAHLDLFWREQIVATLDRLHAEAAITIAIVCHELEAIPPCTRRLVMLRRGEIIADGPPATVVDAAMVESLYGARLKLLTGGGRLAAVPIASGQGDCPNFREEGDCPNFRANENGTVPLEEDRP